MADRVTASLIVQIIANNAQFLKGINKSQQQLAGFTKTVSGIAGIVGVAFGTQQVISFASEVAQLAGQADGVRNAFDRLPQSEKILQDLREATHNTVSELELMRRTVQATNFGIGLEQLPKLFEFAAVRAQQTGESVDYLVNSIVLGIGRKSPLILDNLGISAVKLREKLRGVGTESASIADITRVVGDIADEELGKMGDFTDTAATKFEGLTAAWENFKVSLGSTETGVFSVLVQAATDFLNNFGSVGDKAALQTRELASRISSGLNFDSTVATLKRLRVELETPIKFNVESLRKEFGLTEEQAQKFHRVMFEVNGVLSSQEKVIRNLTQSANKYFSGDTAKAAEDYKNKIYEQILALQIEQSKLQKVQEAGEGAFDEQIASTQKQITFNYSLIDTINEYIKTLESIPKVPTQAVGIIEGLEQKLKSLNEQLKSATSQQQILKIQADISDVESDLKGIKTFAEALNIQIPIQFDIGEVDIDPAELRQKFTPDIDPEKLDFAINVDEVRESLVETTEAFDKMITGLDEKITAFRERQANSFLALQGIFADVVESFAAGQISGIQALQQATISIVDEFLKQALAAAIANAIKTGGPLPVGLALAGVAVAAVKGLFRRNVGRGGAGGGTPGAGLGSRGSNQPLRVERAGEQIVLVNGEFKIRGNDLVQVVTSTNTRRERTG